MDLHEKKNAAEKVRKDVRQKRLERSRYREKRLEAAPVAVGALPPIEGDDRTLWPSEKWGDPLRLVLPNTSFIRYGIGETLTYMLNGSVLYTTDLNSVADTEYEVSAGIIQDSGRYLFAYSHLNTFGNTADSAVLIFTVDKVAPNESVTGDAPALPVEVVDNGLTLKYLNDNPYLDITVPRTNDMLAGDTLFISWVPSLIGSGQRDPYDPIANKPITAGDAAPGAGNPVVRLDSAFVKTLAQGKIAVVYRYQDRTGNFGAYSDATYVHVDLTPGPAALKTPIVDLAIDGSLDRADARLGVEVEIPAPSYENAKPGDEIQVIWEGTRLPRVPVSEFPMFIGIDWTTLSANGDDTNRAVEVGYDVIRGVSATPSPRITVNVSFAVAGPPPDGLDPVNTKLLPVVVKSRDSTAPDNELREADVGQAASARLQLYGEVQPAQVLKLYWGTLITPVSEITITTQAAGETVEFSIAWEDIVKGGYNEMLPVYYSTSNGVNEQESVRTAVRVTIIPVEGLVDVEFPGRWMENTGPVPIINCGSKPWEGIDVLMPGGAASMQAGDTVTFMWQGYSDPESTAEIPETALTLGPITVTPESVTDGIKVKIPYAGSVEPILQGSGILTYALWKDSGQQGIHSTRVLISRSQGSGLCSAPIPPGEDGKPEASIIKS